MSSPFRGPDADSCTLTVEFVLAPSGSCRGNDGDDAVAGRYPDDVGFYRQIPYVGGRVQASLWWLGGWSPPW